MSKIIFVILGSREYQFNRLLQKIDQLVAEGLIKDKVFAQIGQSTYMPRNYTFATFLDSDKFNSYIDNADLVISHGGTGALIGALKKGKQVIAVPRLAKYNEHTDDHQTEITSFLSEMGYLINVTDISKLGVAYQKIKTKPLTKKFKRKSNILKIIEKFIELN